MGDGTHIEWTDATWNIVNGCSVVSPGCTNCYAMRLAGTRLKHHPSREGLTIDTKAGPVWTGETRFNDKVLLDPLRWKRSRKIFVCAHGDLFHDSVPDEWIDKVFAVMALASQHVFQVLTKRPERMRDYCTKGFGRLADLIIRMRRERGDKSPVVPLPHIRPGAAWWPLSNVWIGVSVEDQQRADERIPILLATPAAVRWLSCEPLLGPVDLTNIDTMMFRGCELLDALRGEGKDFLGEQMRQFKQKIDWVVVGGESGPGARPMHPDWARSLRDQCAATGVPFLFKQWGEWAPGSVFAALDLGARRTRVPEHFFSALPVYRVGKHEAGRELDGVQHDGYPA